MSKVSVSQYNQTFLTSLYLIIKRLVLRYLGVISDQLSKEVDKIEDGMLGEVNYIEMICTFCA